MYWTDSQWFNIVQQLILYSFQNHIAACLVLNSFGSIIVPSFALSKTMPIFYITFFYLEFITLYLKIKSYGEVKTDFLFVFENPATWNCKPAHQQLSWHWRSQRNFQRIFHFLIKPKSTLPFSFNLQFYLSNFIVVTFEYEI